MQIDQAEHERRHGRRRFAGEFHHPRLPAGGIDAEHRIGGAKRECGKQKAGPVALYPVMQRMKQEVSRSRPDHRRSQPRTPVPYKKAEQRQDENERRRHAELRGNEFAQKAQGERPAINAAELECECHPVMAGIPQQVWQKNQQRDQAAGIRPWRKQPAPAARIGQQPDQCTGAKKQRGVFGEQANAGRDTGGQPPLPAVTGLHPRKEIEKERGSRDYRRIGRGRHRLHRHHQGEIEKEAGPCRRGPFRQREFCRLPYRPACRHREGKTGTADREGGIAEQGRTSPDGKRDQWRMIVIARRKMTRPQPVIGFIRRQRQYRTGSKAQKRKNDDGGQKRVRPARA